jgi:hypothetical protein
MLCISDLFYLGPSDALYCQTFSFLAPLMAYLSTGLFDALILLDRFHFGIFDTLHSSWCLRCYKLRITFFLAPLTPFLQCFQCFNTLRVLSSSGIKFGEIVQCYQIATIYNQVQPAVKSSGKIIRFLKATRCLSHPPTTTIINRASIL